MLPRGLTSLRDSGKNKASSAAGPAAAAAAAAAGAGAAGFQNVPFATPKHHATEGRNDLQNHAAPRHPSPHRNTMLLKDGTTSKNMLPRGLTSLLDSGKNKASSAAGPAAAAVAPAAAAGGAAAAAPKRTLRHTETPCYWRTERPPNTCCPRGLTSLLDSGKNKASSAAGPAAAAAGGAAGAGAASLQNAPFATPKHHATEGRKAFAAAAAGPPIEKHHGKNHLPAGKHHTSEGRRSPKIAPRKCLSNFWNP